MKKSFFSYLLLALSLSISTTSCRKAENEAVNGYDVFLVIGQSNTHQGIGFDSVLDAPDDHIKQLGRYHDFNLKIITAREPLDNLSKIQNTVGIAMTFAKKYKNNFLQSGRKILLIPGSMGSTGFGSNYWNPGDTLYNDAVMRTNYVLKNFNCKLVAILWHQGEDDIGNPNYQQRLDSMIVDMRKDINGDNVDVPFILGGMVPYWVNQDTSRIILNTIIENTVFRIENTGYANPKVPFLIEKPDNDFIPIHYDANGLREMGRRYFSEFERIHKNIN
jgi:hypothetical protein